VASTRGLTVPSPQVTREELTRVQFFPATPEGRGTSAEQSTVGVGGIGPGGAQSQEGSQVAIAAVDRVESSKVERRRLVTVYPC
jgi:hypothetical protein